MHLETIYKLTVTEVENTDLLQYNLYNKEYCSNIKLYSYNYTRH